MIKKQLSVLPFILNKSTPSLKVLNQARKSTYVDPHDILSKVMESTPEMTEDELSDIFTVLNNVVETKEFIHSLKYQAKTKWLEDSYALVFEKGRLNNTKELMTEHPITVIRTPQESYYIDMYKELLTYKPSLSAVASCLYDVITLRTTLPNPLGLILYSKLGARIERNDLSEEIKKHPIISIHTHPLNSIKHVVNKYVKVSDSKEKQLHSMIELFGNLCLPSRLDLLNGLNNPNNAIATTIGLVYYHWAINEADDDIINAFFKHFETYANSWSLLQNTDGIINTLVDENLKHKLEQMVNKQSPMDILHTLIKEVDQQSFQRFIEKINQAPEMKRLKINISTTHSFKLIPPSKGRERLQEKAESANIKTKKIASTKKLISLSLVITPAILLLVGLSYALMTFLYLPLFYKLTGITKDS